MKILTRRILLLFFFDLYLTVANAQVTEIDSLRKVLQTQNNDTNKVKTLRLLSHSCLMNNDYESAMQYAEETLLYAEKLNFKKGMGDAYSTIGYIYGLQYGWPEARKNYVAALKIWEESGDKNAVANSYLSIAGTFNGEGNGPEALSNTYFALKLYEDLKDKKGIAYSYLMIGFHFFYQEDYAAAMKNSVASLKMHEEIGDMYGSAQSYNLIGEIYIMQANYPAALKNDSIALHLYKQSGDKRGISNVLLSIGNIYEKEGILAGEEGDLVSKQNNFYKAKENYTESLKLSMEAGGSKFTLGAAYEHLGSINIKLKKYSEAKDLIAKGLELSMSINDKERLRDSYLSFSILDSIQGDFELAYKHYKMFMLYRDSLFNDEKVKKSTQLKMQYEFDKKNAINKAKQDEKDAEVNRTRNLQYTVMAAFLLLVVFLYRNNRQKQNAKSKIEKAYTELKQTQAQLIQSEKMASLGELTAGIAHEIQNPLNFVNNFSEVNTELIEELKGERQKAEGERNAQLEDEILNDLSNNLEKITHHGKRADAIVKGMLQHSRSSNGIKAPTDINALADEYLRLSYHGLRAKDKSFNAIIKTDFDNSIGNINIIPQDIGRVLLNLYNNAFFAVSERLKAQSTSYEPTVSVSTKKINGKVEIKVADNGNGIPEKVLDKIFQPFFTTKPTGQGTGLGLSLSYDIVKTHGGELRVKTKEGEGSEFIVSIPFV